jgi:hypothetical protein
MVHAFFSFGILLLTCFKWQLLFLDHEFKLNPITKSFTPLTSRHLTLTDATYHYPNNMPTTLVPGLPFVMGVSFYFLTHICLFYLPSMRLTAYYLYEMGAMWTHLVSFFPKAKIIGKNGSGTKQLIWNWILVTY